MSSQFSEKIKFLRNKLNMNQFEFANYIGIKQPSLSTYERDLSSPTLDVAITIAQKCNVSLDWLCGIENSTTFYTGTDLITTFLKIRDLPGFNYDIEVKWENTDIGCQRYITALTFSGASEGMLDPKEQFDVNSFSEFMQKYAELEKKLASLDDTEIAKEYKKMWLEKELTKYSSIPLRAFKENSVKWDESLSNLLTNNEE